eukprot:CAMPEP_0172206200 /NCGR_PEP_ID=MMETSP1050-20130122/33073_1 /TAXON_ID=233186 /ORGANISM="Cryptomonas curvata, Strain CCAP979/52" /LENGTH=71 /DNA_ID=CAMNT_0012885231 /DNA_START=93 /DNA_END=305 /DNA_ORIENTATION=-
MTVQGASLGLASASLWLRSGSTACEQTSWESDTSVLCRVGQSVLGSQRLSLTTGQRAGSVSQGYSVGLGMA